VASKHGEAYARPFMVSNPYGLAAVSTVCTNAYHPNRHAQVSKLTNYLMQHWG
jgi:hypothetical protein